MGSRRDTSTSVSHHTASTRQTRQSTESHDSRSTAPSSLYDSPPPSSKAASSRPPKPLSASRYEDLSPATSIFPRSSVETYSSRDSYDEADGDDEFDYAVECPEIPPLPAYRHTIEDANVLACTPESFAELFPSMNKLIIRHDDLTPDGNMNLRIDTIVYGRRKQTVQLFHLRMIDLARRDFALRRYCRESGREVCTSKRKYIDAAEARHIPKAVSTALKTLTGRPVLRRMSTSSSLFSAARSRPGTGHSGAGTIEELASGFDSSLALEHKHKPRLVPSNIIKLEFSNYARVELRRRGRKTKKYEFEWWGNNYSWRRVEDKMTATVSYHLFREKVAVAHMVPESRSPNQVLIDEQAGGWIPPYSMWISHQSLIVAHTDVADVVVATGLMALVDDCIKTRWQPAMHRLRRFSLPDVEYSGPRSFVQQLLHRRFSEHHQQRPSNSLRSKTVAAF
ncbi:hypothetical protein F5Y17DRAFT_238622 [Xylariaceae sp. FL0594]|nr:hypothetical protein F5Y17DRAFT_238622 [Xylariaceae sp. FL0594]